MKQPNNWLKTTRKQRGLTQDQLAAELQLAGQEFERATISHWETGRYNMPLHDVEFRKTLARILDIDVADMLKLAGYEVSEAQPNTIERVAEIIDRMSPDKQELAFRILEQFAKDG